MDQLITDLQLAFIIALPIVLTSLWIIARILEKKGYLPSGQED